MRGSLLAIPTSLIALATVAAASHLEECQVTSADPATYHTVRTPDRTFYLEERAVPPPFDGLPPVPLMGFFLGEGTWAYEEANGVPGLQRGSSCGAAGCRCLPSPQFCWLIVGFDPINDENCGHGRDHLVI